MAFVVGFSERLAKDVIEKAENTLGSSILSKLSAHDTQPQIESNIKLDAELTAKTANQATAPTENSEQQNDLS